ncbi:MAG TPA: tetratricopeptide repeat protein [Puia sp.]|jgi:tetratricopeptide (TPR) repeat protein|nr:tetratricopeptide repeat protein [Puia sp.]
MKSSTPLISLKTIIGCATASFLFMSISCALYLYINANPKKLFSENYRRYERFVLRGASAHSSLGEAYSEGNMDSVIWDFKNLNSPVPEEYIMTGIAYLEKNQPEKAIETFKKLIEKNQHSNTDYFEDAAEYYLAMSYLDNMEPQNAMPLLEKIKADPENRYYSDVDELLLLKVRTSVAKK